MMSGATQRPQTTTGCPHLQVPPRAYAACCQLDSEDRPLAGTILYCAQHLTSPSLSHDDIVMATLHELFHALGFSGQLFKKWQDCPSGLSVRENCSTRQQVTRRDKWEQLLLTTPAVGHGLAKHLGVLRDLLGVPLEEEGPLSSHWEARLLQGTIMAASFDGAQRTRLDPITLAAFEDSGWYQVNHSASEELWWGHVGWDAITCTWTREAAPQTPCWKAAACNKPLANGSECWKKENGLPAGEENPHGEIYHSQSRCFLANLTSQPLPHLKEAELTGRCYLHQCTQRKAYMVQAEGSPWVSCLPGEHIEIPGYFGLLYCPQDWLCQINEGTNAVTSPPVSPSTQDLLFQLSLGLAGAPGFSPDKRQGEELAEAVLQALVNKSGTGRCYFHSLSITTNLVFTVHMWKPPGCQGPLVAMLYKALSLTLKEKPLHHGEASFTTGYSKLLVTSDHNPSMTHVFLSMGFCLLLLILVGTLATVAYQKQATLRVGPSTPHHHQIHGTRGPNGRIREA